LDIHASKLSQSCLDNELTQNGHPLIY
jgi:hypothetical protein